MGVTLSRRLVLASASPRRAELLKLMGLDFEIVPSHVDESWVEPESPKEHVLRLSKEKTRAVYHDYPDASVLGADTIVVIDDRMLGKPAGRLQAEEMLKALRGRVHEVWTGFTLMDPATGTSITRAVRSLVTFRVIADDEIAWYVATPEPYDKAGAYAVQGAGAFFIREINGSYTNVMGLPLCEVVDALKEKNILTFE